MSRDVLHSGEPSLRYQVPINQWDEADRPREKLMRRGPSALSDAELIALILGSGTRTKQGSISAVQLEQALLRAYGSLYALAQRDLKELTRVAGVGPAKAVQLVAAFEIGRRVEAQRPGRRIQVRTPADVAACYGPLLRDLKREVFKIVLLNMANDTKPFQNKSSFPGLWCRRLKENIPAGNGHDGDPQTVRSIIPGVGRSVGSLRRLCCDCAPASSRLPLGPKADA